MRNSFVIVLAMMLLVSMAFAGTQPVKENVRYAQTGQQQADELDEIIWSNDFETAAEWEAFVPPPEQPNYWQTDGWEPYSGANSWRCFSMDWGSDVYGGTGDDWLQYMVSPMQDFSAVGDVEFTFMFRAYIEDGDWDGANVIVFYGNDPENMSWEIATPTSPAYTENDLNAFDLYFGEAGDYPGWAGEGTETFCTTYVPATFDLSMYTGYSNVQVVLAFASDAAYNSDSNPSMFGFQVDDIELVADGSTVWADDADGNNIGGPPTFMSGVEAAGTYVSQEMWGQVVDNGAPSPTHAAGITEDVQGYTQYYEYTGSITLPDLNPGEGLMLDAWWNADYEDYQTGDTIYYSWQIEIWNPILQQWVASNDVIADPDVPDYIYVGNSGAEWQQFSASGFTATWDLSPLAGETVEIRLEFNSPVDDMWFNSFKMDDVFIEHTALNHDIQTMLDMPYPTTVGVPVYGKVMFTNNGPNVESGFIGVWQLGGPIYPLYPDDAMTVNPGETVDRWIDIPTDEYEGYWVPTAANQGGILIDAFHTLGNDEVPDNDHFPVDVNVLDEGNYEIGVSSRNHAAGSLSVPTLNTGPTVHISPYMINPDMFPQGATYDIAELRLYAFFWDDGSTGGARPNHEMEFHVYQGGETPGAEIWSGSHFINVAPGYSGDHQVVMDVSDVGALQNLNGPIYVEARIVMMDQNNVYAQPLPYRAEPNQYQDFQFQTYNAANSGNNLTDYGHTVSIVVDNIGEGGPATLSLVPGNTTVPASGGTVTYTINFSSTIPNVVPNVSYWTMAMTPGGSMVGPLMVQTFTHQPNMNVSVPASLNVPGAAPNGTYTFYGHMGFYPNSLLSDAFEFTKGAGTDNANGLVELTHSKVDFGVAGDADAVVNLPEEFELQAAYPNPFNPTTTVSVALPQAAELNVAVFNVMGQQVAELASGKFAAGSHSLVFDGAGLSSGVYFIQAQVPGELNQIQKVTLMK